MTFTDVHHPDFELCTNGSLSHTTEHKKWLNNVNCEYSESEVEVITFSELVEKLNLESLNLLVLDIEGHEVQALKGFIGSRILPEILCIEHGHLDHEHLKNIIEPLGYTFDTISFVNSFYILNTVFSEYTKLVKLNLTEDNRHLYEENIQLKIENTELIKSNEIKIINRKIDDIYLSSSWRITAPFRYLSSMLKRCLIYLLQLNKYQ